MYCAMGLALLCREDVAIGVAVLGAFLVLSGALVREGLILAAAGSSYLVIMKFGVMPLFGQWWFDEMYKDLKAEGAVGFGAIVLTLVSNPSFVLRTMLTGPKLLYLLHMTVPVLALWLRKPLLWLAICPGLVTTLLVTSRPPMYMASFQYTYLWVPYIIAASILAIPKGRRGVSTLLALLLSATALSNQFGVFPVGDSITGGFTKKTFEITGPVRQRYEDLQTILALIPPDAVVSTTEFVGPHVSTRLTLYSLKNMLGASPDYLIVGRADIPSEQEHLLHALESGEYGVVAQKGMFVLAERGANPQQNDVLWAKIDRRHRQPAVGPQNPGPRRRPPPLPNWLE